MEDKIKIKYWATTYSKHFLLHSNKHWQHFYWNEKKKIDKTHCDNKSSESCHQHCCFLQLSGSFPFLSVHWFGLPQLYFSVADASAGWLHILFTPASPDKMLCCNVVLALCRTANFKKWLFFLWNNWILMRLVKSGYLKWIKVLVWGPKLSFIWSVYLL